MKIKLWSRRSIKPWLQRPMKLWNLRIATTQSKIWSKTTIRVNSKIPLLSYSSNKLNHYSRQLRIRAKHWITITCSKLVLTTDQVKRSKAWFFPTNLSSSRLTKRIPLKLTVCISMTRIWMGKVVQTVKITGARSLMNSCSKWARRASKSLSRMSSNQSWWLSEKCGKSSMLKCSTRPSSKS